MIRRVNRSDSYWCTVLYGFTVGATLKTHSASLCCWEPTELKLIRGDSDETGPRLRERGLRWFHSKLIIHMIAVAHILTLPRTIAYVLHDIHVYRRCLNDCRGSGLQSEYSVSHYSALLILEDFIKWRHSCGGVETEELKGISDFSCKLSRRLPTH